MTSVALIGCLTADPSTHPGEKHESCTFRQLFRADVLIAEQADRVESLEGENVRLRAEANAVAA
jgi:hypothetical protein